MERTAEWLVEKSARKMVRQMVEEVVEWSAACWEELSAALLAVSWAEMKVMEVVEGLARQLVSPSADALALL